MEPLNLIIAVILSLLFWGLLRTALAILPALLIPGALEFCSLTLLAFFGLAAIFAPYKDGAFDFNLLGKERLTALIFLTGVITGAVFSMDSIFYFIAAAAYPWLLLQIFRLLRQPVSRVYFLPAFVKWLIPLVCGASLVATKFELL